VRAAATRPSGRVRSRPAPRHHRTARPRIGARGAHQAAPAVAVGNGAVAWRRWIRGTGCRAGLAAKAAASRRDWPGRRSGALGRAAADGRAAAVDAHVDLDWPDPALILWLVGQVRVHEQRAGAGW